MGMVFRQRWAWSKIFAHCACNSIQCTPLLEHLPTPLSEYTQRLLSSMCPPNSISIDLSQVKTMPLAAAIAICADTTPPSLTFFIYNCTFRSKSSSNRTRLPASLLVAQRGCHYLLLFCSLLSLPSKLF